MVKFKALLSTMSNESPVDEKPLGTCALGKALRAPQAQNLNHHWSSSSGEVIQLKTTITDILCSLSLLPSEDLQETRCVCVIEETQHSCIWQASQYSDSSPNYTSKTLRCYGLSKRKRLGISSLKCVNHHGACLLQMARNDPCNYHMQMLLLIVF